MNLQPLLYQDDIFRMCEDTFSSQIGNKLIDSVMQTKLLDKSCYIIVGKNKCQKESFKANPLQISGNSMKKVSEEKYLGDYIPTKGLADSIIVTIDKRMKKANTAIMEVRAVVEDCRAMVTGGISTGLEIWEMAVIPYLLNKCDTWNNLPLKAIEMLDNLQNDFLRSLLATPRTCPTPFRMWETGTMTMENRTRAALPGRYARYRPS
jgi:hypothetical protein